MKMLSSLKAMVAICLASARNFAFDTNDHGKPIRPGHRVKSKQRKKHHTDGRFRATWKIYNSAKLPKNIDAPGFEEYMNVGGTVYLLKHGTRYRLDKLAAQGRVKFA